MTDEVNEQHAGDQWDDDVRAAVAGELRLMDPTVRSARDVARQLLDPDFVEVGASGRRWSREDMLAALPEMDGAAEDGPRYEPSDLRGVVPGARAGAPHLRDHHQRGAGAPEFAVARGT